MRARIRRVVLRIPLRRAVLRVVALRRIGALRAVVFRPLARIPRLMRRLPLRELALRAVERLIELFPVRLVGIDYPPPRK